MIASDLPPLSCDDVQASERIAQAKRLRLFLDYDGTLADFAPSPDDVLPDEEVIQILSDLKTINALQIAIISGRRLSHVRKLIPIDGILLAGTYGVELCLPNGEIVHRLDYEWVRPKLDLIKPQWETRIKGRSGFYLEDKGWSLAIHARFADVDEAERVIKEAREDAQRIIDADTFRILGGDKFLEVGPKIANKGVTVEYLLERYPWKRALSIYVGDDDKDEEAFAVVNAHNGITILVGHEQRPTVAHCRLDSPRGVKHWLRRLLA